MSKSNFNRLIEEKTGMTLEEIKRMPISDTREKFCEHNYKYQEEASSACDYEYYVCSKCQKRVSY